MADAMFLLPEDLRRKSLSRREIVLVYEDALEALDILELAGWAVLGWEPWLKLPEGSHMHPIMGGDFQRATLETWTTYVQRAAQLCRQVMKEEQHNWAQGTFLPQDDPMTAYWQEKLPSMQLHFCLTFGSND
jgi:hypothetical protein